MNGVNFGVGDKRERDFSTFKKSGRGSRKERKNVSVGGKIFLKRGGGSRREGISSLETRKVL